MAWSPKHGVIDCWAGIAVCACSTAFVVHAASTSISVPQDFSQFIIIAVLAGLFWLRKGPNNTVAGAQQVIGLLFFELLFLGFRALFVALFTFPDEYKMVGCLSHLRTLFRYPSLTQSKCTA